MIVGGDDVDGRQDMALSEEDAISSDNSLVDEGSESTAALKRKIKQDCDSRKKLEEKLEEARVRRQIQDYDFDDLD